jgi:plastocyanin
MFSPAEKIGWALAVCLVAVMGVLVAHGPFKIFNKPVAAQIVPHYPSVTVKWVNDPKIVADNIPDPVRVHVGQPVIWVDDSTAPHTATARDGTFDSGNVNVGASYRYIPKKAGTFKYYCKYHPLMHGILIVTP